MKLIIRSTYSYLSLLAIIIGLPAIAQENLLARIRITNNSVLTRSNELAEVNMNAFRGKLNVPFRIIESIGKTEVPYQLEYKGASTPINLLIQVGTINPGQSLVYEAVAGEAAKPQHKTFARYVPERKDDFAWENDLIAFRMYGKALETASDNATGTDIWSKRTEKLILNEWYKGDDYHTDKGEGMDYYQVGITLGAGDIAPYLNDSIVFSKNYHHHKVLDNGPLRSTFQLGYDSWKVGNMEVSATKTISIDAGSQLNRVEVNYTISGANRMVAAAGIVKRKAESPILLEARNGIIGYWEPEVKGKGTMGIGILTNKPRKISQANGHLLSLLNVKNNTPIVYYNGGAWNQAGKITTADQWFNYLKEYKTKISEPLSVKVID